MALASGRLSAGPVNRLADRDNRVTALIKEAKRLGATDAKAIPTSDVFVDERVRFKCMVPRCQNYGRHLMCPPNLISLDDFRRTLKAYRSAILVQLEAGVDSVDKSKHKLDGRLTDQLHRKAGAHTSERRLHAIIGDLETLAFKSGFYMAAGLIGSECLLCEECVGQASNEACRHPFRARPSMQALGIDVIRTSRRAGLAVEFSSKTKVRWTGILLLD